MKGLRSDEGFQLRYLSAGNSGDAKERSDCPTRIGYGVVRILCDSKMCRSLHQ